MFQARKDMEPQNEEERGLRAYVLAKTVLSESLKFMRQFSEKVESGSFGADAEQLAFRLGNSHAFSQALKEIAVAQVQAILSEQAITNEPWFGEVLAATGYLMDKLILATPVQEILATLNSAPGTSLSSQVAGSILKTAGFNECEQYWNMKNEINTYLENSSELRGKLLDYSLSQDPSILNDYLFTIQLFED